MVTMNSFDLLGDADNEDPSQLLELLQQKINSKKSSVPVVDQVSAAAAAAKFSSQAVKERREGYSGPQNGKRGGAGRGRGGRGSGFGGRNSYSNGNSNGHTPNDLELEKDSRNVYDMEHGMLNGPGSRRPGGRNQSEGDRHSRVQNRSGGMMKEYCGKGNFTSPHDQPEEKHEELVAVVKEIISDEKVEQSDAPASEANKEIDELKTNEEKEAEAKKAEEEKEMTLEEYEKVLEEKRKALVAMKAEERKVEVDNAFESMQLLSLKKGKDEIFVKLGSDKDLVKRKEDADREEKVKKSVSINEFLKPAEGERRNYRSGGGRRDRGHGDRGANRGGDGGHNNNNARPSPAAPSIADVGHFPSLGGK
ncbi:hypothetical protein MKX01_034117 [Papaver californicum]|nr:hypothetical protein MKX01_034117 [Papaver californicum]